MIRDVPSTTRLTISVSWARGSDESHCFLSSASAGSAVEKKRRRLDSGES